MAMQFSKTNKSGVEATYWRIAQILFDDTGDAQIALQAYLNKQARAAKASPLGDLTQTFTVPAAALADVNATSPVPTCYTGSALPANNPTPSPVTLGAVNALKAAMYAYLMTLPAWSAAEAC